MITHSPNLRQADITYRRYVILAVLIVVISVLGSILVWAGALNANEAAAIGDSFGGLLSAGSSLAAAVLFFAALSLQRQELQLQREELSRTREEMKEARKVHEAQKVQLEEQSRLARKQIVMQGILELLKLRDQAVYEYERLRTAPARRYVDLRAILLTPQLQSLLSDEVLDSAERLRLTQMCGPWRDYIAGDEKSGKVLEIPSDPGTPVRLPPRPN